MRKISRQYDTFLKDLGLLTEKDLYDDEKLLICVYIQKFGKLITSRKNDITEHEKTVLINWLSESYKVEIASGLYYTIFNEYIYVFNLYKDQSGFVLSGSLLDYEIKIEINFLRIKQRYAFLKQELLTA